jgi:type IV pilus assembly protein PilQ
VLVGSAWTLAVVGATTAWGGDSAPVGRPVLWAQARMPIVGQAPAATQRPRLISLDFKDADINNILRILAEFSGLNVVSSDDVKGKVTVKLQNVPWQQALDSVVRAAKLAYVQEGNIIRVDKLENLTKEAEAQFKAEQREVEITQRRKEADIRLAEQERAAELSRQEFEIKKQALAEAQAPLQEEIIQLKYAHVGVRRSNVIDFFNDSVTTIERPGIETLIRGPAGQQVKPGDPRGLLSGRGELTTDIRTNSLIIRDVPGNLARIKEFIARVDQPIPSIVIEARIVELSKDDARSLGVIWGAAWTPRTGQNAPVLDMRGGAGPRVGQAADATSPVPPSSTAANFPAPSLPAPFTANPFGLALGYLASNFALDLTLQALEGEGKARIVSRPNILTLDNEPANIASGQKFPVISITVVNGAQQASYQNVDITTRLQVTPRIIPGENKLQVGVAVKRETLAGTVSGAGLNAPIVNTRNAVSSVQVPDGATIVVGGLREDGQGDKQEGLPWLRKIPVLGWLFKNDLAESRSNELMVFLTARVVQNPGQAGVSPSEVPAAPGAPAPPAPRSEAPAAPGKAPQTVSAAAPAAAPAASRPTYPVGSVGESR